MDAMTGWLFVTRWGHSLLLLPAASCVGIGLWAGGDRGVALRWVACLGGAVALVLATKLAFLGWGIGIASLDFTGISGHSALAASILPMFAWWLTADRAPATRRRAIVIAALLAVVVGVSRVVLSTHSTSEVVAGLALGLLAAGIAMAAGPISRRPSPLRWAVLAAVLIAGLVPGPSTTNEVHDVVTGLALRLSGRAEVFDRSVFQRDATLDRSP